MKTTVAALLGEARACRHIVSIVEVRTAGPAEQIECDDDVTAVKLARERLMDTAWKSGTANDSWP